MTAVQLVLLVVVVAIQLGCALGVLLVEEPADRLHLVGPVSVFGSILLTVAVALGGTSSTHIAKVVVIGLVLWLSSPFVTRATARALRVRASGRLEVEPDELIEDGGG